MALLNFPQPSRNSKPTIVLNGRKLEDVVADCWDAIVASNDPPYLFDFGGQPVCLSRGATVERLNLVSLRRHLNLAANLVRRKRGRYEICWGTDALYRQMLANPPQLPPLKQIAILPTFLPDGTLTDKPGYYEGSGLYYASPPGLEVPSVPAQPSAEDVAEARRLICDELLGDFPFASPSDRAGAVAALLLPFVRPMIDGPTPLHLLEAPAPGTGKTLLARTVGGITLGVEPAMHGGSHRSEEWRKALTSMLKGAPLVVVFDNIAGRLDSEVLAQALTAEIWGDRLLGTNVDAAYPVSCLWLATSNNATLSGELARRTMRVRLDAKVELPWRRSGFKHPLPGWALDNRPKLVWACLTLIRAWVAAGRVAWAGKPLGSFESWSRTMGGILEVASLPGFLQGAEELMEVAAEEEDGARAFVLGWAERWGEVRVSSSELFELGAEIEGLGLWGQDDKARHRSFGQVLHKLLDRVYSGWRVLRDGRSHGKVYWRLESLPAEVADPLADASAEASGAEPASEGSPPAEAVTYENANTAPSSPCPSCGTPAERQGTVLLDGLGRYLCRACDRMFWASPPSPPVRLGGPVAEGGGD